MSFQEYSLEKSFQSNGFYPIFFCLYKQREAETIASPFTDKSMSDTNLYIFFNKFIFSTATGPAQHLPVLSLPPLPTVFNHLHPVRYGVQLTARPPYLTSLRAFFYTPDDTSAREQPGAIVNDPARPAEVIYGPPSARLGVGRSVRSALSAKLMTGPVQGCRISSPWKSPVVLLTATRNRQILKNLLISPEI